MADISQILRGEGQTLIPQLHIQQIGVFLWRRGIELLLLEDDDGGSRKKFLDNLFERNKTSLYFQDIWERGAKTGEILLYIRPWGNGYTFKYYDATQFEPFYDDDNQLERVVIRSVSEGGATKVLELSRDRVEVWEGRSPEEFAPDFSMTNPYGFVPAVVVGNRPVMDGRGKSEFYGLTGQIEQHDWQIDQVHGNVEFFGGPIFYSSRSQSEMIEAGLVRSYHSVAEEGGYGYRRSEQRIKARKIISGLEEGEEIGFVTPTPIDESALNFIEKYESDLRTALGGINERTPPNDGLFNDMDVRLRFSLPITTAYRRANSYITYGIVELYRLALDMATQDGFIPPVEDDRIVWRYSGDVFPDTASTQLTKSIVSRNLIRLGVNLHDAIQHIFPEKREEEIDKLLKGGFAYELFNGVSQVGSRFNPENSQDLIDTLKTIILEGVEDGRGR